MTQYKDLEIVCINDGEVIRLPVKFTGKLIKPYGCYTYNNGLLHSFNDMPAINEKNIKVWYKNGDLHRLIGPTYINKITNEKKFYYLGKEISKEAHDMLYDIMKLRGEVK